MECYATPLQLWWAAIYHFGNASQNGPCKSGIFIQPWWLRGTSTSSFMLLKGESSKHLQLPEVKFKMFELSPFSNINEGVEL